MKRAPRGMFDVRYQRMRIFLKFCRDLLDTKNLVFLSFISATAQLTFDLNESMKAVRFNAEYVAGMSR